MTYEFSKLELWWKDIDDYSLFKSITLYGTGILKIYERKWYNPLRYIFAKHGVLQVSPTKFIPATEHDCDCTKRPMTAGEADIARGLDRFFDSEPV